MRGQVVIIIAVIVMAGLTNGCSYTLYDIPKCSTYNDSKDATPAKCREMLRCLERIINDCSELGTEGTEVYEQAKHGCDLLGGEPLPPLGSCSYTYSDIINCNQWTNSRDATPQKCKKLMTCLDPILDDCTALKRTYNGTFKEVKELCASLSGGPLTSGKPVTVVIMVLVSAVLVKYLM